MPTRQTGALPSGHPVRVLSIGSSGISAVLRNPAIMCQKPATRISSTSCAAENDFTPNFLLRLMAKDLTYARDEGQRHKLAMNTATAAITDFEKAINAGYGEKDLSAIIPAMQKP